MNKPGRGVVPISHADYNEYCDLKIREKASDAALAAAAEQLREKDKQLSDQASEISMLNAEAEMWQQRAEIAERKAESILTRNAAMEAVLRECREYVQQAVNEDEREYNLRPLDEGCRQNLEESSALLHGIDQLTAKGAGQ